MHILIYFYIHKFENYEKIIITFLWYIRKSRAGIGFEHFHPKKYPFTFEKVKGSGLDLT